MKEREPDRDREQGKERGGGDSARGLLPDLYNSSIIEAVQSESRAKACVKKEHTQRQLHASAHKQDRVGA